MEVKAALVWTRRFLGGCGGCEGSTFPPMASCGCPRACWTHFQGSPGFLWPATGWRPSTESPSSRWWGYSSSSWREIPGSATARWGTSSTGWSGWFTGVSGAVSRPLQISNTVKLIVLAGGARCYKTYQSESLCIFLVCTSKLSNRSN